MTAPSDYSPEAAALAGSQAKPGARYCPVMRRKEITHGSLNLKTGKITSGKTEVVVEACRAPLFGAEHAAGICRDCAKGWDVPENRVINPKAYSGPKTGVDQS